jgi:hypothetical protein
LFALGTAWVLFLLAKELLHEAIAAALAVLVWAVNPCGLEVSQYARPYELLGLVSMLLAWRCVRWAHVPPARERRWREASVLFAVSLAGVLTHYSFVFMAAAAGAYLLVSLGLKRSLTPLAVIGAGIAASNAFHPTFKAMLAGHHDKPAASANAATTTSLLAKVVAFFDFNCDAVVAPRREHVWIGLAVLLVLLAATVWLRVRHGRGPAPAVDLRFLVLPAVLVAILAGTMALGLVPRHAMHTRHLSFLWPLLGVVVAYPFAMARMSGPGAALVPIAAGIAASAAALHSLRAWPTPWMHVSTSRYAACKRIVTLGTRRTSTLRVALEATPELLTFSGTPSDLDRALTAEPVEQVCIGKGEDTHILHVLAKHHVATGDAPSPRPKASGKRRKGKAPPSPTPDDGEQAEGED